MRTWITRLMNETRAALDILSQDLVVNGRVVLASTESSLPARLIVSGYTNLLENVTIQTDIELL